MSQRKAKRKASPNVRTVPGDIQQDSDFLLAFLDTMEAQRREGVILAWGIRTHPEGGERQLCEVRVLTVDGAEIAGNAPTWREAHRKFVDTCIELGTKGAPSA